MIIGLTPKGFAPSVASLGALSFELHKQLAEKYSGKEKWGYSRSKCISVGGDDFPGGKGDEWLQDGTSRAQVSPEGHPKRGGGPSWLSNPPGSSIEVIDHGEGTAQV